MDRALEAYERPHIAEPLAVGERARLLYHEANDTGLQRGSHGCDQHAENEPHLYAFHNTHSHADSSDAGGVRHAVKTLL